MADARAAAPDILALEDQLVSPLCGIVRELSRVHKDPVEPALPLIWRTLIANHQFSHDSVESVNTASGKGLDHDSARRGALGEAVERYCALRLPAERVRIGPAAALPGPALDPRALVLYAEDQYPALDYEPYADGMALAWVEARHLDGGGPVWVPAEAAFLSRAEGTPLLAQATSNGLAAGASWSAAALGALCEVIERDAFIIAWYNRLPVRRIDWRGLPDAGVRGVAEAYARRGVAIELYRLPADHPIPVFAAVGFEDWPGGLAAVVGLGCDLSPAKAAAGAILEVGQVRAPLRQRVRRPESLERRDVLVADPSQVAELEDHDLLYTDPRMIGAFDLWRGAAEEEGVWDEPPADVEARLATVAGALGAIGAKACICDLTTPDIAGLGLTVVRAIIEDFQPIHFGETEIRLGGSRLYELPARIGLAAGPTARADLNPLPHPLA
jgi:ribosomal protein S12 methylthiotransferase accessory factor